MKDIALINMVIEKVLESGSVASEDDYKVLLNEASKVKKSVELTGYAELTEYDILVKNIRRLKEKLGIPEENPKILTPYGDRELERGKALSEALSSSLREYLIGLQAIRDARYAAMIEEQEEIDAKRKSARKRADMDEEKLEMDREVVRPRSLGR